MQFQKYFTIRYTRKIPHVVLEYKLWQLKTWHWWDQAPFLSRRGWETLCLLGRTSQQEGRSRKNKRNLVRGQNRQVVLNCSHLKRFLNTFPFIYYVSCSTSFLREALGLLFHLPTLTAHMKPGRDQSPTSTEGHAKTLCLKNTEKWKKCFQEFWESIYVKWELRNPVSANAPVTRNRL